MIQEFAPVPRYLVRRGNKVHENILAIGLGVVGLAALARIAIPLPWTPVPITGQTFGVTLLALTWGRSRGVATVLAYLLLGAAGAPVLAGGDSGISFGPTFGYMIGMIVSAAWIGTLVDRGWTKTFLRTYLAAASGSVLIFLFGVAGLSAFVPARELFVAGVLPFLPGDFVKTLLASVIAFRSAKADRRQPEHAERSEEEV